MKNEPDVEEKKESFAEKKTFCTKCLAKDINFGGNPNNF